MRRGRVHRPGAGCSMDEKRCCPSKRAIKPSGGVSLPVTAGIQTDLPNGSTIQRHSDKL